MTPIEEVRDAAVRASMRRHPAGSGRLTVADAYFMAVAAGEAQPPPCNDCGDPGPIDHRTGTRNGLPTYINLCEACERECDQEWEVKRGG